MVFLSSLLPCCLILCSLRRISLLFDKGNLILAHRVRSFEWWMLQLSVIVRYLFPLFSSIKELFLSREGSWLLLSHPSWLKRQWLPEMLVSNIRMVDPCLLCLKRDTRREECELLRRAAWFPYEKLHTKEVLVHCKLCLMFWYQDSVEITMGTQLLFLEVKQLLCPLSAK